MAPLLEIRGLTKQFSRVLANDKVSLSVEAGEVRALLGENGAGKSTLMSCIYGLYKMDAGEILIEGNKVAINSCDDAIKLGIGMVNQHFMLIDKLSVVENVILGMKMEKSPWLNKQNAAKKIKDLSDRYNFNIDPYAKVESLSVGMQQRVEILKILFRESNIMIFDEPTAVLTPNEVLEFFRIIDMFRNEGRTILFITHKLHEIMTICDSVTILRDGQVVGNVQVSETSENQLANLMVGRDVELNEAAPTNCCGKPVLEIRDLVVKGQKGLNAVDELNLTLCSGEILGIAGVDGNGQLELGQAITGLKETHQGSIMINGEDIGGKHPKELLSYGLSHIPPDRQKTGLILDFSIEDNLVTKELHTEKYSKYGFISRKRIRENAKELIQKFDIRGGAYDVKAGQLSGGNQQKIVIAREFTRNPKLIIAIQPTRGLDISAIDFVWKELIAERDGGAAVLLISTELEEILALSDRIEVMYEGKFTGQIEGHHADPMKIGLQMAGKTQVSESKGGAHV